MTIVCRTNAAARLGALFLCTLLLFAACRGPENNESPSGSLMQSEDQIYEGGWAKERVVTNPYAPEGPRPSVAVWTLTDMAGSSFSSSDAYTDLSISSIYDRGREYDIRVHYAITQEDPANAYGLYSQAEEDEQIHRLVTELLAGGGPDVLILDGCNAQDFAAKGALMDLAGVAREAGVYENLTQGLMLNGELPYLPYLARTPLLWGPPEQVREVESFAQLAESMLAGPAPQWPEHSIQTFGPGFATVYPSADSNDPLWLNMPPLPEDQRAVVDFAIGGGYRNAEFIDLAKAVTMPWLVQNGALDTAALQNFFSLIKRIYDASDAAPPFQISNIVLQFPQNSYRMGVSGASLHLGYSRLAAASTGYGAPSFLVPAFTALAKNQPLDVRPFPAGGAVWQPHVLMAVNKNSKNPELALRFIRDMLSDEYQLGNEANGDLPVTQSAVQAFTERRFADMLWGVYAADLDGYNLVESYGEDNPGIQWLKEPVADFPFDLDALMRSFDTVYLPEPVLEDAVSTSLWDYVSGELSLEEAVAQCEAIVSLYLAEKQ